MDSPVDQARLRQWSESKVRLHVDAQLHDDVAGAVPTVRRKLEFSHFVLTCSVSPLALMAGRA